MDTKNFIYKSYCELVIISNEVSPETISEELDIPFSRGFRKGDQNVSKHSGSVTVKPHNLWALKSDGHESDEETISCHINFFKLILDGKLNILQRFKNDVRYDISFFVWIETDNSGIGLSLDEDQITFINSFSNEIRLILLTI